MNEKKEVKSEEQTVCEVVFRSVGIVLVLFGIWTGGTWLFSDDSELDYSVEYAGCSAKLEEISVAHKKEQCTRVGGTPDGWIMGEICYFKMSSGFDKMGTYEDGIWYKPTE